MLTLRTVNYQLSTRCEIVFNPRWSRSWQRIVFDKIQANKMFHTILRLMMCFLRLVWVIKYSTFYYASKIRSVWVYYGLITFVRVSDRHAFDIEYNGFKFGLIDAFYLSSLGLRYRTSAHKDHWSIRLFFSMLSAICRLRLGLTTHRVPTHTSIHMKTPVYKTFNKSNKTITSIKFNVVVTKIRVECGGGTKRGSW